MGIEMAGVREYCECKRVELGMHEDSGRLVVRAWNEGGSNCTEVDVLELVAWLKQNRPDLLA